MKNILKVQTMLCLVERVLYNETRRPVKVNILCSCCRRLILLTFYFSHSSLNCCENDGFQLANSVTIVLKS